MPAVKLRFPAGRYHATPWGHHVNEGLIEWPPCPWRLLRALIATGYSKLDWGKEIPETGRRLIAALAGTLPKYQLPPASGAHSRHYMPIGTLEKGREKTTLVFDTWANVGDGELLIQWDCKLDQESESLLGELATKMSYLGRSESLVIGEMLAGNAIESKRFNAYPHSEGHNPGRGWEQVSLLAPVFPKDYVDWREPAVKQALAEYPLPKGKKPTKSLQKKRDKAREPYPNDLIDCLQKDTAWWKGHKWSHPPGSQKVIYCCRADAIEVSVPRRIRQSAVKSICCVLLALATPSRNKSALPMVYRTLPQAELLHRALISRAANGQQIACPELTGLDKDGKPLAEGHKHAHIIPLDLDGDRRLDHILIYAPIGLGDTAQNAIRRIKRTWTKGGVGELQLAVIASGEIDDLQRLPEPLRQNIRLLLASENSARTWVSQTPFVPPRHLKPHGKNTLEGQVNAELRSRGLPSAKVTLLPKDDERVRQSRHYVRARKRGGSPPPADIAFTLKLELEKPITGPLILGYGCHFGMGLFFAVH